MICYKYRLYPNKEQIALLWKHANKCNWLYNYFLNQRIECYKSTGKIYKCDCGYVEDRDVNAAKNIFCLGQAIISGLCTESSMIQEALPYKEGFYA